MTTFIRRNDGKGVWKMDLKGKIILLSLIMGVSTQVFAQSEPKAQIKLKRCLVQSAVKFVTIPASTVGLRQSTQIDALFRVLSPSGPFRSECVSEIEEFKEQVSSEEADLNQQICEALKASVGLYLTPDETDSLMSRTKSCGGHLI